MSVNLSSQELIGKGLVEEVRHTLARSGVPPTTLVLEMTERVIMSDTEVTINRLEQLRARGAAVGRRLRHRFLVAQLPAQLPDQLLEDRPAVPRRGAYRAGDRARARHHRARSQPPPAGRGRGGRAAGAVGRPARHEGATWCRATCSRVPGPERIERLLEGVRFAEAGVRAARGGVLSRRRACSASGRRPPDRPRSART